MSEPKNYDKAEAIESAAERALTMLSEHADSVQILATWTFDDGEATGTMEMGRGNFHARVNAARMWVKGEDAQHERDALRED